MQTGDNKEEWIEAALNSTRGMSRARPPVDIYAKTMVRLAKPPARQVVWPVRQWAAAAIVLLALNIGSVVYFLKQDKPKTTAGDPLLLEMQLVSTYNY